MSEQIIEQLLTTAERAMNLRAVLMNVVEMTNEPPIKSMAASALERDRQALMRGVERRASDPIRGLAASALDRELWALMRSRIDGEAARQRTASAASAEHSDPDAPERVRTHAYAAATLESLAIVGAVDGRSVREAAALQRRYALAAETQHAGERARIHAFTGAVLESLVDA